MTAKAQNINTPALEKALFQPEVAEAIEFTICVPILFPSAANMAIGKIKKRNIDFFIIDPRKEALEAYHHLYLPLCDLYFCSLLW
jgi:hypothetical protein